LRVIEDGNEKLGKNVFVISRPVGLTCPSDCFFLHNGCYAERTEKQYPNARRSSESNVVVTSDEIEAMVRYAYAQKKSVRIHERGDWCLDNQLDLDYLSAWRDGVSKVRRKPFIFTYTHLLDERLAKLGEVGISVYASVHNAEDIDKAKSAGFTLFAYVSSIKKKRGGSGGNVESYISLPVLGRTLVCPEQRLGRKRVTCDKCKVCIEGKQNVLFLTH
jgi:hypothetical protein